VLGLLVLAGWQINAYAERRADAREAEIRALWEADTAVRDKVAADALAKAEADKAAALTRNQEIEYDYQQKLAAADAGRDDLERLLQRTRSEVRRGASREATSVTIATSAGEARRLEELRRLDDRIAAATADLRVEAGKNADQLDALLAEIGPQL
jgi:hypothetical protein